MGRTVAGDDGGRLGLARVKARARVRVRVRVRG